MNMKNRLVVVLCMIALLCSTGAVSAQQGDNPEESADVSAVMGAGFTYQGYLTDLNGTPIHNSCDMSFNLWDAQTSGNIIGGSQVQNNVRVERGYFTVTLNNANQFGSQPFDGSERYLGIMLWCVGDTEPTNFARQPLRAAPYAQSLVPGTGKILSTADTTLYLSPFTAMTRGSRRDLTITPLENGAITVSAPANTSGERLLVVPVTALGSLLGSTLYVKSIYVCYKTDSNGPQFIDGIGVYKGHDSDSYTAYLSDGTNRTASSKTCFNVNASTRVAIDNSSYIQFHLYWDDQPFSSSDSITIYTIKLVLSEYQS